MPTGGAGGGEAWIRAYIAEALDGHSSRTMQMVAAVRSARQAAPGLQLEQLQASLERESTPAGRNRLLRRWLADNTDAVVASWRSLGLPSPPDAGPEPSGPGGGPAGGGRGRFAGVAVFDFDQTLTVRHLGVFEDLGQVRERSFGGAARLGMLTDMLGQLQARGVAITLVTRNSSHTVQQALKRADLWPFVTDGLVFGFEDYDNEVPKSHVVREQILRALGLRDAAAIFVDDDPSNIVDMQENCPNARVLRCPRQGLGEAECRDIVAWAEGLR